MATTTTISPVGEEMRQLFLREDYESLLIRTDNLQKRKRLEDETTKHLVFVLRALSQIQLGRHVEALKTLNDILPKLSSSSSSSLSLSSLYETAQYARLYIAWAMNEGVEDAVMESKKLEGDEAKRLHAQLLYRCGRYEEAAKLYETLFYKIHKEWEKLKQPKKTTKTSSSRWRLISSSSSEHNNNNNSISQVSKAELDRYADMACELGTNAMAALVLAGHSDHAMKIKTLLPTRYELEYNSACADISHNRFNNADVGLQNAEALLRSKEDVDDEDDIEEALVPVTVQKAYLRQLAGDVAHAKRVYEDIMTEGRADAASLAVAANNLTVALGQLAFEKQQFNTTTIITTNIKNNNNNKKNKNNNNKQSQLTSNSISSNQLLPREQHEALVEGLKKMRATAGKSVERKLTTNQRRAMAYNRAILLVQMNRIDACRTELARLKADFPGDSTVSLIEASLVARQAGLDVADDLLVSLKKEQQKKDNHDNIVNAARAQLAYLHGESIRAATLLCESFPNRPASYVTAAALFESQGQVDKAISLLQSLISSTSNNNNNNNNIEARKTLAQTYLRVKQYENAANILRDVVKESPEDSKAIAQLVIATSFLDANEAESYAVKILPMVDTKHVDVMSLELAPPPKRKQVAAMKNTTTTTTTTTTNVITKTQENDNNNNDDDDDVAAKRAQAARERKKKKKKKRLPKNYDPNGPPPDPERWLPKTLRSGYKKKKGSRTDGQFKGAQGSDAATADAAAVKNAQRAAAKAAATVATDSVTGPAGRARASRKNKKRR